MLLKDFNKLSLPFSYIPLVTAIAVDYVSVEEDTVRYISETSFDFNDIRLAECKEQLGDVKGFIHYIYTYNVMSTSSLAKNVRLKSLLELDATLTEGRIYDKVAELIMSYPKSNFIYLFAQTRYAKRTMKKTIRKSKRMSADKVTMNELPDDVVDKIYTSWLDFFNRNVGVYSPEQGNFVSWLVNNYSCFFNRENANTHRNPVNDIINTKSLEFEHGEGDQTYSLLDRVSIDDTDADSFDFIKVATKINIASLSLFNHKGSDTAYYDIFSLYRDTIAEEKMTGLRKRFDNDEFTNFIQQLEKDALLSDSFGGKFKGRCHIAQVFFKVIQDGISAESVYELYQSVVQESIRNTKLSTQGNVKDGTAHYAGGGINAKTTDKNCDLFKKEYEGFIALKKLIDYLNSSSNHTGYSIFTMPTEIFRDYRYLRRFSSLPQYLGLLKDVRGLCNELIASPKPENYADSFAGLRLNDYIYNFIKNRYNYRKDKEIVNKLSFAKAAEKLEAGNKTKKEELLSDLQDITEFWQTHSLRVNEELSMDDLIEQERGLDNIVPLLVDIVFYLTNQFKKNKEERAERSLIYYRILQFKSYLEYTLYKLGHPVKEGTYFSFIEDSVSAILEESDEFAKYALNSKTIKALSKGNEDMALTLIDAVVKFVDEIIMRSLAFLVKDDSKYRSENISMFEIRKFFSSCSYILALMQNFQKFVADLSDSLNNNATANNLFLVHAKSIYDRGMINVNHTVNDLQDLYFLRQQNKELTYSLYQYNMPNIYEITSDYQGYVIQAVNVYLSMFKREFLFISSYRNECYADIQTISSCIKESSFDLGLLKKASLDIYQYQQPTALVQELESQYRFNEEGYLVRLGQLFSITENGSRLYYHKKGYVVSLNIAKHYTIREITSADLTNVRWKFTR